MRNLSTLVIFALILAACGKSLPTLPEGSSPGATSPSPTTKPVMMGEVGNGAHGIMRDGKLYLVDFVERGIEKTVRTATPEVFSPYSKRLEQKIKENTRLSGAANTIIPWEALAQKLAEIYNADPVFGMALINTLEMYHWSFVESDLSLIPLKGGIIKHNDGDLVLIANRRGRSIHVSLPAWRITDIAIQVGVITHELIYALIRPEQIALGNGLFTFTQNAPHVRELNAFFYDKNSAEDIRHNGLAAYVENGEFPYVDRKELESNYEEHLKGTVQRLFSSASGHMPQNTVIAGALDKLNHRGLKRTIVHQPRFDIRLRLPNGNLSVEVPVMTVDLHRKEKIALSSAWKEAEAAGGKDKVTLYEFVLSAPEKLSAVFQLSFATYQEGTEVKSYIKFEKIQMGPVIESLVIRAKRSPKEAASPDARVLTIEEELKTSVMYNLQDLFPYHKIGLINDVDDDPEPSKE